MGTDFTNPMLKPIEETAIKLQYDLYYIEHAFDLDGSQYFVAHRWLRFRGSKGR